MPQRRSRPRRRRLTEKRKPRKPASQDGEWWTIRHILNERAVKGKIEYLVDWEDNQATGEAYPPSWVPASDVLDDAIEEWETKEQSPGTQEAPSQAVPECPPDSEESQPPRPPNYRTLKRLRTEDGNDGDGDADETPRGKRPRVETASPSLEPVPSITSSVSFESAYEEPPKQRPQQYLAVEIQKTPAFDASEYLSVHGSQSTAVHSSQPLSELESQDQRIAIPLNRSQGTIPDSQDLSSLETVESQRREAQQSSEPNPVVIPDSQDFEGHKGSPHKTSNHRHTPASDSNDKFNTAHEEVIAVSTSIELDIPSRQPDQDHSGGTPDLSGDKTNGQGARQGPSLSTSVGASQQAQTQTEPVFYTQPNFDIASQVLQSSKSVYTQDQDEVETSGETLIESPPPNQLEETRESTSGASQAAQIIHRPCEPSQDQSWESHSTDIKQPHLSLPDSEGNELPLNSTSQSIKPSRQSTAERIRFTLDAFDQGKDLPESNMFAEREDKSRSPDRRVSAVNQLQNLWDEVPTEEADQGAGTEGHSSAAAELAAFSVSESQDDRSQEPERISPAAYFTQPPQPTDPWRPQGTFEDQAVVGDPMSSVHAIDQPRQSAVDSLQDLVNRTFGPPEESSSGALIPPRSFDIEQGTVSPADVSKPIEAEKTTLALLPSLSEGMSSRAYEASGNSITMGQVTPTHDESPESSVQEPTEMDHIITLPFQASIRDLYIETIYKYKDAVKEFGELFANEIYQPPEESLVKTIDELFNRLQNLCDYPEDIVGTSIENLPPDEKVKYSLDANPKFNFLFELLQGINKDTNILIIARSVNLLRPLVELVEVLELDCTCDAIGHSPKDAFKTSAVRVTLALPDTINPTRFDVVVGYDDSFDHSAMSADLAADDQKQPLVLRLTTTFSIEHIDLEMPDVSSGLERKGALLVGLTKARGLIRDPPPLPEPYEIAKIFIEYLNDETDTILWEPNPLPGQVLDVFFSSQAISQKLQATPLDAENGRKRKLDDEDDAETKRMRRLSIVGLGSIRTAPPLTTAVRALLDKVGFKDTMTNQAQLSVPLLVLEALAAKMAEAERAAEANNLESEYKMIIDQLDKRVKEYEASAEQMYEKHRSALEDRTQFETQTRKAERALQAKTEEMQRGEEKSAAKIAELEAKIARLTDDATTGSSLGATDKLLQEATEKNRVLEKQLQNSRREKDYAMDQYQLANSSTMAMRAEIDELKEQNEELKKKASDNLRNINKIQKQNTARELVRKIAELETRLKEREIELDRVREELRQLKNGRRETRQVSVPRSPRMGIMSPRGAPRGVSGSASRGASPSPAMGGFDSPVATSAGPGVPVIQFTNTQAGNGRWNPLQ